MRKVREAILKGEVVIVPTETVYGLLCLESAKKKLLQIKQRPEDMPIARVYASAKAAIEAILSPSATIVAKRLLPGPYTIITEAKDGQTIGIRVSTNKKLAALIKPIKENLILTSANLHKNPPATTFTQAIAAFPNLKGIDGGPCEYAKPSTLVRIGIRDG